MRLLRKPVGAVAGVLALALTGCFVGTPGRGITVVNRCDTMVTVEFASSSDGYSFYPDNSIEVNAGEDTGVSFMLDEQVAVSVRESGFRQEFRFPDNDAPEYRDTEVILEGDACP